MPSTRTIETLAGIEPGTPVGSALAGRAEIMALSQAAHDAVLLPIDPGGLSHAERAALASRMARHLGDPGLADQYASLLDRTSDGEALAALADPERCPEDPRRAALVRHVDLLTREPRCATRASIKALASAGLSDADIVRLSELAAFVNYQARVIAGLRLLRSVA